MRAFPSASLMLFEDMAGGFCVPFFGHKFHPNLWGKFYFGLKVGDNTISLIPPYKPPNQQ